MGRNRGPRGWSIGRHRNKWVVHVGSSRISTGLAASEANRQQAEAVGANIARDWQASQSGGTIDEILEDHYATLRRKGRRSVASAEYAGKALSPFFGGLFPSDVTSDVCRGYADHRRSEGIADGTIRRELGVLRAALNQSQWAGQAQFEFPPIPVPRDRALTHGDVRSLLARAELHTQLYIQLAIATGARRGAILALRWGDIDFEAGRIRFPRQSGGKRRAAVVPLTQSALSILKQYRRTDDEPGISWRGKPVKSMKTALIRTFERAGIDNGGQPHHVFRHTAGVWMASAGVSMEEIADRLGHSDIKITRAHYARYHPDAMRASTSALELDDVQKTVQEEDKNIGPK